MDVWGIQESAHEAVLKLKTRQAVAVEVRIDSMGQREAIGKMVGDSSEALTQMLIYKLGMPSIDIFACIGFRAVKIRI